MGRPATDSIAVATPSRILDAALLELAARGFEGARLADIAVAAGITRPSLLYHFASKEQLYAATMARAFSSLSEMILDAVGSQGAFRDRLRFLVSAFLEFAKENPAVCKLLLRAVVADEEPATRALLIEHAGPLVDDVTRFFARDGEGELQPGVPLRAVIMGVIVNVLAKTAAGPLRAPLWGAALPGKGGGADDDDGDDDADTWLVVEHALLRPVAEAPNTTARSDS